MGFFDLLRNRNKKVDAKKSTIDEEYEKLFGSSLDEFAKTDFGVDLKGASLSNKLQSDSFEIDEKKFNKQVDRNLLGKQLEKEGKTDQAISLYTRNVAERFEGNFPYDRLAIIYRKQKDYDKEIDILKTAIDVFENDVPSYRPDREAKLAKFQERLAKAEALLKKK